MMSEEVTKMRRRVADNLTHWNLMPDRAERIGRGIKLSVSKDGKVTPQQAENLMDFIWSLSVHDIASMAMIGFLLDTVTSLADLASDKTVTFNVKKDVQKALDQWVKAMEAARKAQEAYIA